LQLNHQARSLKIEMNSSAILLCCDHSTLSQQRITMSAQPQGSASAHNPSAHNGKTLQKLAMVAPAPIEHQAPAPELPMLSSTLGVVKMSTFLLPTEEDNFFEPTVPM
jgi:hypothetical protein